MESFFIYLAKVSACITFIVLVYSIFLRKCTFFGFNRLFLVLGLSLSFVVPFISISYDILIPASSPVSVVNVVPVAESSEIVNVWNVLLAVYLIGVSVVLARSLYTLHQIYQFSRTGSVEVVPDYSVVNCPTVEAPFSAFNRIYLNAEALTIKEKQVIIKHEICHIKQKHWLDLLCGECALLLLWFNPLVWYYVFLQKENHEYLVDEAVLSSFSSHLETV